jgi:hypothetical protein
MQESVRQIAEGLRGFRPKREQSSDAGESIG